MQKKTWLPSGKTRWDFWADIGLPLLSAAIIPIVVFSATMYFTYQQDKATHAQQEEDALKTYLDDMTTLLFDKKLGSQAPQDATVSTEAAVIAQAKTFVVLSRLTDPQRKAIVVQFLYKTNLINDVPPIVLLDRANLEKADLHGEDLDNINLNSTDLNGANLSGAHLRFSDLGEAQLNGADLSGVDLSGAILGGADLSNANLSGATVSSEQLAQAKSLKGTIMPNGSVHP
ncbi:MAG: hypothetical protein NVS2B12_39010 [Ktedonobacteraceae bacterium]